MSDEPPVIPWPPPPTDLASAKAYLTFVADYAARGLIEPRAAQAATGAVEGFCRVERYAEKIRELERQMAALQKASVKAARPA